MRPRELPLTFRLGWELFIRNIVSRYRNSKLGYLWLIASPLVMAGAWIFLKRTGTLNMADTGIAYGLYVVTGIFIWQGFSRQLNSSLSQLSAFRHLFGKYHFPWEAIVLAGWAEAALEFAVSMAVLVVVLRMSGSLDGWGLLLSLPWMVSLLLLGGGIGLLMAPIGLLYEDVGRIINLGLQLMFFLVPIVYPRPTTGIAQLVVEWNPAAVLLIATREALLLGQTTLFVRAAMTSLLAILVTGLAFALLKVARPHLAVRAG